MKDFCISLKKTEAVDVDELESVALEVQNSPANHGSGYTNPR